MLNNLGIVIRGTGLGLATIKHILELHESEFGVTNTNQGVTFSFTLYESMENKTKKNKKIIFLTFALFVLFLTSACGTKAADAVNSKPVDTVDAAN